MELLGAREAQAERYGPATARHHFPRIEVVANRKNCAGVALTFSIYRVYSDNRRLGSVA
jgi:hypothetical protein